MDYFNTSLMTEEEKKEYNSMYDLVTMMEESMEDDDDYKTFTPKRLMRSLLQID